MVGGNKGKQSNESPPNEQTQQLRARESDSMISTSIQQLLNDFKNQIMDKINKIEALVENNEKKNKLRAKRNR